MDDISPRNLIATSGATFLLGAFVSWAVFYEWRCAAGAKPFDAPAWVQAVGSVAAILVAIAIPAWQRSKHRADERAAAHLRAQSLASSLFESAKDFYDVAEFAQRFIHRAHAEGDDGQMFRFAINRSLQDARSNLHLLGPAGSCLLRALYHADQVNALRDQNGYIWREDFGAFMRHSEVVEHETRVALEKLHSLLK